MHNLADRFANSNIFLEHVHEKGKTIVEPIKHMQIFLWYAGHTSSYADVADRFNVTVSTLFAIIGRMNQFFDSIAANVIKWPSPQQRATTKEKIFKQSGFPGVIGFIDGTHIRIDRPTENQESYCNRKHYHSVQAQIICDDYCKIIDCFIGYPGSVHDARVFQSSFIFPQLQELCQDGHLLGDSAYRRLSKKLA
ncbi:hypothetical protein PPYR_01865 [Photinus pyralis]|uniref:DDE Tnp4 domain-containing protein n=1 Tax=Photinus pyralis TaxID=7054 RepID=A0A5N4B5L4_PHOPY|nr:hypothetical protein PPYR_01865 [Photinus pyralis]